MTTEEKTKMIEGIKNGTAFVVYAREFKLSPQRISQIIYATLSLNEIKKIKKNRHNLSREKQRIKNRQLYHLNKENVSSKNEKSN